MLRCVDGYVGPDEGAKLMVTEEGKAGFSEGATDGLSLNTESRIVQFGPI